MEISGKILILLLLISGAILFSHILGKEIVDTVEKLIKFLWGKIRKK